MNHLRFYQACKNQGAVKEAIRYTRLLQSSSTLQIYNMLLSVCRHARDTDGMYVCVPDGLWEFLSLSEYPSMHLHQLSLCLSHWWSIASSFFLPFVPPLWYSLSSCYWWWHLRNPKIKNPLPGALRVLAMLESTGLKADCIFYTSLISACAKAGKVDLVFQVKGHLIDSSTLLMLSLVEDSEMGVKAWSWY